VTARDNDVQPPTEGEPRPTVRVSVRPSRALLEKLEQGWEIVGWKTPLAEEDDTTK
jgi:hypothetical protein